MFFGLLLSKSTQNKNFTLLFLTVFNLILSKSSNYVEAVYLLNVCALAYQLDIFNLCLIDGVINNNDLFKMYMLHSFRWEKFPRPWRSAT